MAKKEAPPATPSRVKFETSKTAVDHEFWIDERTHQTGSYLHSSNVETQFESKDQLSHKPRPATTDLAQHDLVDHRVVEMSEPSNNVHPHTSSEKSDGSAYLVGVAGAQAFQEEFSWCPPGQKVVFRLVQAEAELFHMISKGRYVVQERLNGRKTKDIHYISHTLLCYIQKALRLARKAAVSIQYHLVDSGDGKAHLEVLGMASVEHENGGPDLSQIHQGLYYICSQIAPRKLVGDEDVSANGLHLDDSLRLLADQAIYKILDQVGDENVTTTFKAHIGGEVINCGPRYAQKRQPAPIPLRDSIEHIGFIENMRTSEQSIDVRLKGSKSLISMNYNPDKFLKKLRVWLGETMSSRFVCAEQANGDGKNPLLSLKDFQDSSSINPDLFGYDR
ncbi:hypothetical protein [Denitratisoma sp. DHT3]|uniref:hypothetical protein n=1 Tax=Denitratisoma sp. DHT3 TaxID=1981880 RepID=UPI0011A52642|nr:hypothetical protein [Denitratisoma sp. DHT3]